MLMLMRGTSFNIAKRYIRFKISMDVIRGWEAKRNYPCADLILDQGPIFDLALARKEKLYDLVVSADDVAQVQRCIQYVYKMGAPVDILYRRVRGRSKKLGRGQFLNAADFSEFCAEYDKAFSVIHELDIPTSEISTGNFTPAEVLQRVNDVVNNG